MKRLFFFAMLMTVTLSSMAQLKLTSNNIDKVLKSMTIEEKAQLLVGFHFGRSYTGLPVADNNSTAIVPGAAGFTADIGRLGIPHTVLADGPAGLRINPRRRDDNNTYYCTGFPIGTLLAATFNSELVYQVGQAMGNEVLEYGCDVLLGPGMNLMRNPLCGRNFEYYSEDPFLVGFTAAAMIDGIQSMGVGVSAKHFAGNNQETNRLYNNAIISQRALRELYLKGFEIAVRKSQPWTIMSSYNKINGLWTHENKELLTSILRDEWGFKGIVMTDWTGTRNTKLQVAAGNDLLTPGNAEQYKQIVEGAKNGTISMNDINRNVRRMLQFIVKTPHFRNYHFSNKPDIKAHAAVARKAAPEGMVLLKNNGVLPFKQVADTLPHVALFGITSYKFYAGGTGSGDVNKPYVVDLKEGLSNAGFVMDKTLTNVYEKYKEYGLVELEAEMGRQYGGWFHPRPRLKEPQYGENIYRFAAENNDVAIVTIGRNSGEGQDRPYYDFNMYADEIELLNAVSKEFHKLNKKVIVILNVGGAVETASWRDKADAVLLAWQPGMEGGNAIANVLVGVSYPSGKLPVTFPLSIDDVPSTKNFPKDYTFWNDSRMTAEQRAAIPNYAETIYEEDLNVGYRYFQTAAKQVSYPFGYGLGYTTFAYSNPTVEKKGNNFVASVRITNTGNLAGKEVVQLYITAPQGKLKKPVYELKAYAKTRELQPGESQVVYMPFSNYELASYDESQQSWVTDGGQYTARFAASVADIRQNVPFNVKAQKVKCHDVLKP
ncbi:MAG: glycoside hydrolase family 3 protein [Prevotella sp.]|nr:glycoside hydrolase family 3 protein [Prevotella sp.]